MKFTTLKPGFYARKKNMIYKLFAVYIEENIVSPKCVFVADTILINIFHLLIIVVLVVKEETHISTISGRIIVIKIG